MHCIKYNEKEENKLNSEYKSKIEIGMTIFWTMTTFIDGRMQFNYKDGTGWHDGKLLKDIGPCKKGDEVKLNIDGDNVDLLIYENDIWKIVYKFNVILQSPIITENKDKL